MPMKPLAGTALEKQVSEVQQYHDDQDSALACKPGLSLTINCWKDGEFHEIYKNVIKRAYIQPLISCSSLIAASDFHLYPTSTFLLLCIQSSKRKC